MKREESSPAYRWDLTAVYADEAAVDAEMAAVREEMAAFAAVETTMTADAASLYAALCAHTAVERKLTKLHEYAMMTADLNLADNRALALRSRVQRLEDDWTAVSFFFTPTIVLLEQETLDRWFAEQPALEAYRRVLDSIRRYRPYTLSDESEKLLADMSGVLAGHEDIRGILANAELRFGRIRGEDGRPVEVTGANYVPLLMSSDRRVRRAAFSTLYRTYDQFGNTLSALLEGFVKERVTLAKIRGYENSLQASVFDDEVTPEIYHTLIQTVNRHLPVLYDYYDLKREALGVPHLHLYDVYAPMTAAGSRRYSYEQAMEMVLDTVSVFGEEYRRTLEDGLKNRHWADVYPAKGKRDGAYSAGGYDVQPYMLLNYTETFDDVCTLAHEAGHSMHTWYAARANTPQDSGYTIFVAEVASTVNELLLVHKLLRETEDKTEKLAILDQLMEIYKGTLFRQTMFAEFEETVHRLCTEGEPLTRDTLCQQYEKLVKRYFGPRVVCDRQIAMEWMRIPHFYYDFYVYKYATCLSAASSIVKRLETEGEAYAAQYLDFLKCGNSKSPLESLQIAGVDLTDPAVIEDAIADFKKAVSQFRELQNEG
ncbi:MAG: oligoendopeptidase F [Clostridia bacterium]|nr:oligoendopeptidase F [Clostridia bacterium]